MTPKVFIGSSSESKAIAEELQMLLEPKTARCQVWDQSIFELGKSVLEDLTAKLDDFDFAILVLAPDDALTIREQDKVAPRDNVIFELGLFMGALGRERTIFVIPDDISGLRLPTDILGVTAATYSAQRFREEGGPALGRAATLIRKSVEREGPRRKSFATQLGDEIQDVEAFYEKTGLTYAFLTRDEAIDKILTDIKTAKIHLKMYARVYISNLVKGASRFLDAVETAATNTGSSQTEFVVTQISTDYRDDALVDKV